MLSANSLTIAYGQTTTPSSVGGFNTLNWAGGCPAAAEVVGGTLVNGFVFNPTGSEPTATIITPIYTGGLDFTATAHVPVFASVGGIYCMATD